MTERYKITIALQRELARFPEMLGAVVSGTSEDPAVVVTIVYQFFK